jgi:acetyl-CoA carboxylase, biotin carboxylase subunit
LRKVLIANRGEIALRAARSCRRLGLDSVAVYSAADRNSPHIWAASEAVCIGPPPSKQSYLNVSAMIETALRLKCDAIYPGYGFLSEKSEFARICAENGLTFVGPDPETIALMGDKAAARRTAAKHGVPVVPGSEDGFFDGAEALAAARKIGFPILLKASAGGGGRGMRIAPTENDFSALFEQAAAEAEAAFGHAEIYLERFFAEVRHIEIQVFGDRHGNHAQLWERDCSVQRRHQKLVEEAPSPVLSPSKRREIAEAALELARAIGYVNAGTIEFIYDPSSEGFYFIEMNTRIQVEHPVTEVLTGIDLVAEQFRVAAGQKLSFKSPPTPNGTCAIEFRINAEDPGQNFRPAPGTLQVWQPPAGAAVRLDTHAYEGYRIPPYYDSMLGKLIVSGSSRKEALELSRKALEQFNVSGVPTTLPFHAALLNHDDYQAGRVHTRWVENQFLPELAS